MQVLIVAADNILKHQFNYDYVVKNTCVLWGKRFLDELLNAVQSLISDTPVPMASITDNILPELFFLMS